MVLFSPIGWYWAYSYKTDMLENFENSIQVVLNLYSVPFAWIHTVNNWAKWCSIAFPVLLLCGVIPTFFWWVLEGLGLLHCTRLLCGLPKRTLRARHYDEPDQSHPVQPAENERNPVHSRELNTQNKRRLHNLARAIVKAKRYQDNQMTAWKLFGYFGYFYIIVVMLNMLIGVYAIFQTSIYVALGILLKMDVSMTIMTGIATCILYTLGSIKPLISKYTRLKCNLFKCVRENKIVIEAQLCNDKESPINNMEINISELSLEAQVLKQVSLTLGNA